MMRDHDDDEDEYRPARRRGTPTVERSSRPVERKIISPRMIKTLRWASIVGNSWCVIVVFLILSGIWSFGNDTSDIYLKVITMLVAMLNVLWAWLFPNGDE